MKTLRNNLFLLMLVLFLIPSVIFAGGKKDQVKTETITPNRIVSLGASATEILFALDCGDKVVARTDFCNYPPEASSIPSLGGFSGSTFSVETILSYKPDFVYLFAGMHEYLIDTLNQYEIQYYLSDATSVDSVCSEITDVAKILGKEAKGKELVKSINDSMISAKNDNPKSVYWEVWNEPYMSIGNQSFINDIIEKSGAKNIFADVDQGYPVVSEESIIARNPDFIIIPSDSMLQVEDIMARAGWQDITAIKNKAVYMVDGDITTRPGPRICEAITIIHDIVK